MLYIPPSGSLDPNASYVGKNVAAGTQGSRVPPGAVENPQREIAAIIAAGKLAGLDAPSNADLAQMLKAIRSGLLNRFVSSGAPDAIAIAPQPVYTGLVEGMRFRFKVPGASNVANTSTNPTFQVNGLSAIPIKTRSGNNPAVGDLVGTTVLEGEIDASGNLKLGTSVASDNASAASNTVIGNYVSANGIPTNSLRLSNSTRLNLSGNGGNFYTAISNFLDANGNPYVKKGPASGTGATVLKVEAFFATYVPTVGGAGATSVRLTDGTRVDTQGLSGAINLQNVGAVSIPGAALFRLAGVPAGTVNLQALLGRSDTTAWNTIVHPDGADFAGSGSHPGTGAPSYLNVSEVPA